MNKYDWSYTYHLINAYVLRPWGGKSLGYSLLFKDLMNDYIKRKVMKI